MMSRADKLLSRELLITVGIFFFVCEADTREVYSRGFIHGNRDYFENHCFLSNSRLLTSKCKCVCTTQSPANSSVGNVFHDSFATAILSFCWHHDHAFLFFLGEHLLMMRSKRHTQERVCAKNAFDIINNHKKTRIEDV